MNEQRLRQIENHLRRGALGHRVFNFCTLNELAGYEDRYDDRGCGTAGCAIGEFPIIWPEDWEFSATIPALKSEPFTRTVSQQVADWLDISIEAARHLFYPTSQATYLYGGKDLDNSATQDEVADNILAFINSQER